MLARTSIHIVTQDQEYLPLNPILRSNHSTAAYITARIFDRRKKPAITVYSRSNTSPMFKAIGRASSSLLIVPRSPPESTSVQITSTEESTCLSLIQAVQWHLPKRSSEPASSNQTYTIYSLLNAKHTKSILTHNTLNTFDDPIRVLVLYCLVLLGHSHQKLPLMLINERCRRIELI